MGSVHLDSPGSDGKIAKQIKEVMHRTGKVFAVSEELDRSCKTRKRGENDTIKNTHSLQMSRNCFQGCVAPASS
eukprot:90122-Amphidinium_carterae.1